MADALDEVFKVESGSSAENDAMSSVCDVRSCLQSFPAKPCHVECFVHFHPVDHVMVDLLLFFTGGFGGADVHSPVYLHGID